MDRYLFKIGNFGVEWYSVLILLGVALGILILIKEARRYNYNTDFVFNMAFWTIVFGIIGARIYYVLFNLDEYHNILDMFKVWEGGLAIHGGLIVGLITMIIYCKKYKIRTVRMLDFAVPAIILAQAVGRWGNFFNSEVYGIETTLEHLHHLHIPNFIINGMNIGGVYYTPLFLYESLWCLLGFIVLLVIRRIKNTKVGTPLAFYLIWYGAGRFVFEGMRTSEFNLLLGGFKVAQIVSIIMILAGLVILMINYRKGRYEDLYNQDNNQVVRF